MMKALSRKVVREHHDGYIKIAHHVGTRSMSITGLEDVPDQLASSTDAMYKQGHFIC
jgi:hypothetical protein